MAVPKKKSSNVKLKYSIKKKEYLKKVINGKTLCKICNFELKYSWKKKICINCIKKIKKK